MLGGTSDTDIGELAIGKKRWVVPKLNSNSLVAPYGFLGAGGYVDESSSGPCKDSGVVELENFGCARLQSETTRPCSV